MSGKTKIKVGVLRGGPSPEYEISLASGASVLDALKKHGEKYEPHDIWVDRRGGWHYKGLPADPSPIFKRVDVVFNAMHGAYGEDGKAQRFLDGHGVPYTGSGAASSALAMQKHASYDIFRAHGLLIPKGMIISGAEDIKKSAVEAIRKLGFPMVIKPASVGSSVGIKISNNFHEVLDGLNEALKHSPNALAETYIKGREATCGVLEDFRGEKHYALPAVEIIPPKKNKFFDYECKYDGSTEEICPGRFGYELSKRIRGIAVAAHKALGCRHYSRSDFLITPDDKIFILETNTLPGLTDQSLFPKSAKAAGLEFHHLIDHLVSSAHKKESIHSKI